MSKTSNKKTAGKIFVFFTVLVLAAALAFSAFIDGQTKTCKKYFSAIASGDYNIYSKVVEDTSAYGSKSDFSSSVRADFQKKSEFSELGDNDIISTNVKIKKHKKLDSDRWECNTEVDFYSDGKSISEYYAVIIYRKDGRWYVDESSIK